MKKLITLAAIFFYASGNAQTLHGDMETWRNYSVPASPGSMLQSPVYWNAADSMTFSANGFFTSAVFTRQVYPTTDAHTGSTAAKLVTRKEDTLQMLSALLTNADIALDFAAFMAGDAAHSLILSGGAPITSRVPAVTAWVKYYPTGTDSGFVLVDAVKSGASASGGDSVIGYGRAYVTGLCNTYTLLTANINYTDASSVPDLLRVIVTSSGRAPQDTSTLYVDDVNIVTPSSIENVHQNKYAVYPVPASDHIAFHTANNGSFGLTIFSTDGRTIGQYQLSSDEEVNVSALASGVYYYTITTDNAADPERGKFILNK